MTAQEILSESFQEEWLKEYGGRVGIAMERYKNQQTANLQAHILHFKNIIFDVGVNTMDEEVLKLHDKYVEFMGITTQRAGQIDEFLKERG